MQELADMFPLSMWSTVRPINAWDDPNFVQAVEATGRKKLIAAGATYRCPLYFPADLS